MLAVTAMRDRCSLYIIRGQSLQWRQLIDGADDDDLPSSAPRLLAIRQIGCGSSLSNHENGWKEKRCHLTRVTTRE